MAKNKKGKTAPISRPAKRKTAPGANAPPAENCWRYAPALCLLALAAAVFGLHLGYAGGDANRYLMMDHAGRIAGIYQVSQNNDFPLPYALQTFNYLFPDILITLGLSHLLGSPYAAIHVYAALAAFVMAA
ncbi:MAG: hypothetical protein HAW59_02760, partial [Betaproteobacteria bacterium]|nr:hypothetical protein [Betaproteobacteria bacterium]